MFVPFTVEGVDANGLDPQAHETRDVEGIPGALLDCKTGSGIDTLTGTREHTGE